MTTATIPADRLPDGATPVRVPGLPSWGARGCPPPGGAAAGVARDEDARQVYWCARGAHHFTTR